MFTYVTLATFPLIFREYERAFTTKPRILTLHILQGNCRCSFQHLSLDLTILINHPNSSSRSSESVFQFFFSYSTELMHICPIFQSAELCISWMQMQCEGRHRCWGRWKCAPEEEGHRGTDDMEYGVGITTAAKYLPNHS